MTQDRDIQVKDGIRIGHYADWMFEQVIDMFVAEYGVSRVQQEALFRQFYEESFQRSHGIRLVAVDRDTVCGFQSYFYWPYVYRGKTLRTFQSGNSLVAKNYRGRQIFARLLNYLFDLDAGERPGIDFLMGFPVEMSYGGFIRNKWANPLDMVWYAKPVHPLSVVLGREPTPSQWLFELIGESIKAWYPEAQFSLSKEIDFANWRRNLRDGSPQYLYFHYGKGNDTIRFDLKPNRRGRINELVIGDISRSSPNPEVLREGVRELCKFAKKHAFLTMLSVALNETSSDLNTLGIFREYGFYRLNMKIHFIVKPITDFQDCTDEKRWNLLRSDIDTW